MKIITVFLVGSMMLLPGCAAVMEGTTQDVAVNTVPSGASCTFARNGQMLGAVLSTPASFHVDKTKDDLMIDCSKGGMTASYLNISGYPQDNWLYILVGGPVGWGYDSIVGADNMYTSPVTLDLSGK